MPPTKSPNDALVSERLGMAHDFLKTTVLAFAQKCLS